MCVSGLRERESRKDDGGDDDGGNQKPSRSLLKNIDVAAFLFLLGLFALFFSGSSRDRTLCQGPGNEKKRAGERSPKGASKSLCCCLEREKEKKKVAWLAVSFRCAVSSKGEDEKERKKLSKKKKKKANSAPLH